MKQLGTICSRIAMNALKPGDKVVDARNTECQYIVKGWVYNNILDRWICDAVVPKGFGWVPAIHENIKKI